MAIPVKAPSSDRGYEEKIKQLEYDLEQLKEQNQNLMTENSINNLIDEKTYRLQLLTSLNRISSALEPLKRIEEELTKVQEEDGTESS